LDIATEALSFVDRLEPIGTLQTVEDPKIVDGQCTLRVFELFRWNYQGDRRNVSAVENCVDQVIEVDVAHDLALNLVLLV
jgi:hypothetical protein